MFCFRIGTACPEACEPYTLVKSLKLCANKEAFENVFTKNCPPQKKKKKTNKKKTHTKKQPKQNNNKERREGERGVFPTV